MMKKHTVIDSAGVPLGEFTALEILYSLTAHGPAAKGINWSEAFIAAPAGRTLSPNDFLWAHYPELLGYAADENDVERASEEPEDNLPESVQAFRNLECEWAEGDLSVSAMDSSGDQVFCLELSRLKELVARGLLPQDYPIRFFKAVYDYTYKEGKEPAYFENAGALELSLVISRIQHYEKTSGDDDRNDDNEGAR